MRDVLVYGGRAFAEFNVTVDLSKSFGTPEKDYEIVSIPGRNGDLSIFNNRFKDITISIPCFIRENFLENFRGLTEYLNGLNGYQRLESSKEPNHFRKALFLGIVEPKTGSFNKSGSFTINFRCQPQRWLKSAEDLREIDDSEVHFMNPTNMPSKPLLRVHGNMTITFKDSEGDTFATITTTGNPYPKYIVIDCETFDCYDTTGNRNSDVTFTGEPQLNTGVTRIDRAVTGTCYFYMATRYFVI